MIFFGTIKNKQIEVSNKKLFADCLLKLEGKKVEIEVRKYRSPRTDAQNKLYWAWIEVIANDTGYTKEELHASFKAMFLMDRSKKIPLVRSTSILTTSEFTIYLGHIERQAAELGIVLPHPEEQEV